MTSITTARPAARANRSLVWGLAVTQTVGWGVLFYALPVVLVPMQDDVGWERSTILGAFALAILVSGLLAPAVGRRLDRNRPRLLMAGGSTLATVMVLAWSQVGHPVVLYLVWAVIGVAKAAVLYDAAFPVIIKRCAPDHTRALLTVTLAAGLASFVFQPLTSWLTSQYGWRTALLVLAVILGAVTIPIHWMALAPGEEPTKTPHRSVRSPRPPELREKRFWLLTGAFAAVTMTSFSAAVLLIAYLHDSGWTLSRAAIAGGTLGAMQVPGRIALGRVVGRIGNELLVPALLVVPAAGVLLLLVSAGNWLAWPAVCLLGIGQGATILLRATMFVDLYGTERIGALNGASALPVTAVRALGPFGASVLVAQTAGYEITFLLLAGLSVAAAIAAGRALHRGCDVRAHSRRPPSLGITRDCRAGR
ncbi:MAG: MFS transporter [Acidimicrobiales bacterium]